jgi:aminoglycoside phosphotransferase (APT) family kinase protein
VSVELIASGRDADVWALDGERVLRRYRDGRDMDREASVMRHAAAHGYPVPRVYGTEPGAMVLERLYGPTMLASLLAGSTAAPAAGAMLGDLLVRLGSVPAAPAGAGSLLHLDLHPDNVVLTDAGPVVIDWSNATAGPSTLDVAMSALILAEVAVGGLVDVPGAVAQDLLGALLRVTGPADPTQLRVAVARRTANPTLTPVEKSNLPAAAALVRRSAGQP